MSEQHVRVRVCQGNLLTARPGALGTYPWCVPVEQTRSYGSVTTVLRLSCRLHCLAVVRLPQNFCANTEAEKNSC